jgi:hypothetical protein
VAAEAGGDVRKLVRDLEKNKRRFLASGVLHQQQN